MNVVKLLRADMGFILLFLLLAWEVHSFYYQQQHHRTNFAFHNSHRFVPRKTFLAAIKQSTCAELIRDHCIIHYFNTIRNRRNHHHQHQQQQQRRWLPSIPKILLKSASSAVLLQSSSSSTLDEELCNANNDTNTNNNNLRWSSTDSTDTTTIQRKSYTVIGLDCVQVAIHLPIVGSVTIVEANAQSQETLVDLALELDEDNNKNDDNNNDQNEGNDNTNNNSLQLTHGDPYGAVLWPAASAVASYMISKHTSTINNDKIFLSDETNNSFLSNKLLIEIGAGTGLISIAMASLSKNKNSILPSVQGNEPVLKGIIATDYESIPLQLLQYAATNKKVNPNVVCPISTAHFDICDCYNNTQIFTNLFYDNGFFLTNKATISKPSTGNRTIIDPSDILVVAADIMYEPKTGRAMAYCAKMALEHGFHVIIGDSPGRAGRPAFLQQLSSYFDKTETNEIPQFQNWLGTRVIGTRHELICGENSTSYTPDDGNIIQNVSTTSKPEPLPIAIMELDPIKHKQLLRKE